MDGSMKVLVVATIWIWVILAPALAQKKLTFDLDNYSGSIDTLRNEVKLKDKGKIKKCHDLPILSDAKENEYLLLELRGADKAITLTVQVKNLYIEGYSDEYDRKCRSFVVKGASTGAGGSLCGSGVTAQTLGFTAQYNSLLDFAGKDTSTGQKYTRETFPLGIGLLKDRMVISQKPKPDTKAQAQFFLSAIQMIAEAVRFAYIQGVVSKGAKFYPDSKMTVLEECWGKVSTAVQDADKNGKFTAASVNSLGKLSAAYGKDLTKVDDVKADVGLLQKIDIGKCKKVTTDTAAAASSLFPHHLAEMSSYVDGLVIG